MKWQPWNEYKDKDVFDGRLPIEEPPCKYCKWFYPSMTREGFGIPSFTACIAEEMYHDFGCFEERE